jgi:hypothetical protein
MTDSIPSNGDRIFNLKEDFPLELLATGILPFVGNDQYRFLGGVSHQFEEAYSTTFPTKTTRYNMTTMKLAKFCWNEAPTEDKPMLPELTKSQTWYRTVSWDDLDDEDWAMLPWIRSTFGCIWGPVIPADTTSYATCVAAAAGGQLDALKWARMKGSPWDEASCQAAAMYGHLEVLKWARTNGCPWDEGTCKAAAAGGHLKVLKWARKNHCPWNEDTCQMAAKNGHLKVLKWARRNNCP